MNKKEVMDGPFRNILLYTTSLFTKFCNIDLRQFKEQRDQNNCDHSNNRIILVSNFNENDGKCFVC